MPGDAAAWYRTSDSSLGEFTSVNAIDADDDVSARVAYTTAVLSLRHPLSSDPSSLDNDLLEAACGNPSAHLSARGPTVKLSYLPLKQKLARQP